VYRPRSSFVALTAVLLFAVRTHAQDPVATAAGTITGADVLQRIGVIAHDSMRGRNTPSPGLEMTAAYIASQLQSFGLRPGGDSASFIQRYPYNSRSMDTSVPMIEVTSGATTPALTFARDFFVIPSAADSVVGTPWYVGTAMPGMTLPPNLQGRIVIAAVPDTVGTTWQQRLTALFPAAMAAGAAGVILILDPAVTPESVAQVAAPLAGQLAPFPIFGVRADAVTALLAAAGLERAALFSANAPAAREISALSLRLRTPASVTTARVPNVVAILPGSDSILRNEYVVFSAHMDHDGVGTPDRGGDSIFNGADDDASGTTAVVEIAQAFAALPTAPRRSIIFLTVSGEEKGLLGSAYFVDHSPVPVASIVANINMDMIGRNHPDSVTAIGLDYTSLGETAVKVAAANAALKLVIAPDRTPEEQLFLRSDHFNFARKSIPAIFFTTGLHADYHRPSDEVETIDTAKLARIARFAFLLGNTVANETAKPVWTKAGQDVLNAMRATGGQ
jgi:hypothetical protein